MQLDDLLAVLRSEVAQSADEVDAALMAWLGDDPANAPAHSQAIAATADKVANVSRMLGMNGQALAVEWLRDVAQIVAMSDPNAMAEGLAWLTLWRDPLTAAFNRPGDATVAQAVVDYLQTGPLTMAPEMAADLHTCLCQPPELPQEDSDTRAAAFADPVDDDTSLAVPDDVDPELYETFLADAPEQLARLGDTCRALGAGAVDVAQVVEAQRVAHTFKGSGNIIGIRGVGKLAHRMEDLLEFAVAQGGTLPRPMARDLEAAAATLDQMVYHLRGEEEEPADALPVLHALNEWARAIDQGQWQDKLDATAPPALAEASHPATALPTVAQTPSDAETQVRVGASRLERLVRRAGQQMVQQGRLSNQIGRVQERLTALAASQQALDARLRELQTQLERQGVSLQAKAAQAADDGQAFDPLEMDRYNELHALMHFVTEMAADSADLAQSARDDAQQAGAALLEHERDLKTQHAELMAARLLPFKHIASRLRRTVSQTAAATGKSVRLAIDGEATQVDADVLAQLTEPLLHLLRNAIDHGIEPAEDREFLGKPAEGTVHLTVRREGPMLHLACRDDGRGLDLPAIQAKAVALGLVDASVTDADALARLVLLPGFSTRDSVTDVSGRGVGMDVVAERVRAMKGHIDIHTEALAGTTFTLRLPATSGTAHALVVEAGGQLLALPTEAVITGIPASLAIRRGELLHAGNEHWPCADLATLLGLPSAASADDATPRPAVVVRAGARTVALLVDRVVEARELILQDVGALLRKLRPVAGSALRNDGRVMFLLNADALAEPARALGRDAAQALRQRMQVQRRQALVVDDSLSVRKSLAQLLGDAGYEVRTARDGFDALAQLGQAGADIVLTDLEMPQLNGLDFTRRLRQEPAWQHTPVIMITSRASDKHREGAERAGVNLYLTKPYTDADLLARVRELLAA